MICPAWYRARMRHVAGIKARRMKRLREYWQRRAVELGL